MKIGEALNREIKKEIAEEYFSQRIALEQSWLEYKKLDLNVKRFISMLDNKDLIEEVEKITHFPLNKFHAQQSSESANLRKTFFEKLKKKPFGLTTKSKFIRLFVEIYQDLIDAYKSYKNALIKVEEVYKNLKTKIEHFYKKYDLGQILAFIAGLRIKLQTSGL